MDSVHTQIGKHSWQFYTKSQVITFTANQILAGINPKHHFYISRSWIQMVSAKSWRKDLYTLGDEIIMILFAYITFSRGTFLSCVSDSAACFHPAGVQQKSPVTFSYNGTNAHISTTACRSLHGSSSVAVFGFQVSCCICTVSVVFQLTPIIQEQQSKISGKLTSYNCDFLRP